MELTDVSGKTGGDDMADVLGLNGQTGAVDEITNPF